MAAPSESMDDDSEELNFRSPNFNPLRALQVDKLTKQPANVQPLSNIAEYDTFIKKQRAKGKNKSESSVKISLTENSVLSVQSTSKNTSRLSRLPVPSTVKLGSLEIEKHEITRSISLQSRTSSVSCNILSRMEEATKGPAGVLRRCLEEYLKVKVWIRSHRFVRGFCIGYLVAFDRHWNLAMVDVDETYRKPESYPTGKRRKKKKTKKRDDEAQPPVEEMPNVKLPSASSDKRLSPTSKLVYEIFGGTDSVSQDFHDVKSASSAPMEMESDSCELDSSVSDAQMSPASKLVFQIFGEDSNSSTLLKQKTSSQRVDMKGISSLFQNPGERDNAQVRKDKKSNSEDVAMDVSNTMHETDGLRTCKKEDKHDSQVTCVRSNPVTELKKFKIPKIGKSCASTVKREETMGKTQLSKYSGNVANASSSGDCKSDVTNQECAPLIQEERRSKTEKAKSLERKKKSTPDQTGSDIGEKTDKLETRISRKDKKDRKCSLKSSSSKDREGKNLDQRTDKANPNQKPTICKKSEKVIKHECKDAIHSSNAEKCETIASENISKESLLQTDKDRKCSRERRPKTEHERSKVSDKTGKVRTCSIDKISSTASVTAETSGDKNVRGDTAKSSKIDKEKSRKHSSERKHKSHREKGTPKSHSTVSANTNVPTEIIPKAKSDKVDKKTDKCEGRSRKSKLEKPTDTSTSKSATVGMHRSKVKSSEKESKHHHSQEKHEPIISKSSVEKEASSTILNVEKSTDLRVGSVDSSGKSSHSKRSQEKKHISGKCKENSDNNVAQESLIKVTAAEREKQSRSRSRKHSHERKQKTNIAAAKDKIESENSTIDKTSNGDHYQSGHKSNTDVDVVCSHVDVDVVCSHTVMNIEVERKQSATSVVEMEDRSDTGDRRDNSEIPIAASDHPEIDEAAAMMRDINLADIKFQGLDTHPLSVLHGEKRGPKLDQHTQIKEEPISFERDTEVAADRIIKDAGKNYMPNTLTSATDISLTTPKDRADLESNKAKLSSGKAAGNKDRCKQPAPGQTAKEPVYLQRHVNQLFIRGDNVVIINVLQ